MRPLFARCAGLRVPHLEMAALPSPLEEFAPGLWIKRDDVIGGGKLRKLEFFVPRARASRRTLVGIGPEGSNWLRGLVQSGLPLRVLTIPQHLNADAVRNRRDLRAAMGLGEAAGVLVRGLAEVPRLLARTSVLAPLGGTDPWTTLGWVNAAFELLSQVVPEAVYVPLGSGGTAAGLALGFALAGAPVRVRAVRITSAVVANARRVRSLAEATARVLGVPCPALPLDILHGYVGRGYGHPLPAAERARARLPVRLDSTYTAKAALAFLEGPERTRLFWLTFAP